MPTDMYDKEGKPLDMDGYVRLTSDPDYKIVLRDNIDDKATVSTVWLGLNHNYWNEGPPLIFETMIFASEKSDLGKFDSDTYRYATEEEARANHERICEALRAGTYPLSD